MVEMAPMMTKMTAAAARAPRLSPLPTCLKALYVQVIANCHAVNKALRHFFQEHPMKSLFRGLLTVAFLVSLAAGLSGRLRPVAPGEQISLG